ncbi:2Fe-2S iron-sulfur cluster binding domain-containing protein [Paenibacillus sp. LMG 31458]|uniref:2Fe-2S iron-sulfur cluster binding domain-containing protein n=1 Tax=Paenibacillus phytorum TaxID=2654977 RepID=A0ABX1XZD1_9BACL|nr:MULTISPECIES: (2Fe-2S)-binding protein [Paenibacillus]KQX68517.1 xanthine dehydrogenase subunit E [Paenibacillus sp. Root444D2]KRE40066.1 xanthine dehydrogenase subunit E [Paenibacillus sp. Soil724D2]NOU73927.1 2Fe-2S iron-sulfur cluster binding domain-containing protein [Paenibacillus phytorum]
MINTTYVLECSINGKAVAVPVPASKRMSDILRDDLLLTGTKVSCEIGRCGACMVLLDGKPVNSCLLMAYQAAGKEVTTIEGISAGEELHPVQQAMLEEGGLQCGYCTAGMVVTLTALWEKNPTPTRAEAEEALCGNICRCTGYEGIFRAVERCGLSIKREG